MKLTLNFQQVGAWLLRIGAVAAFVLQYANVVHLPANVRAVVVGVAGSILAVDRYVSDPSTGTPAPKT